MKYHEDNNYNIVKWIESNPNYIFENFEGIRKKNARIILLILLNFIIISYLIYIL